MSAPHPLLKVCLEHRATGLGQTAIARKLGVTRHVVISVLWRYDNPQKVKARLRGGDAIKAQPSHRLIDRAPSTAPFEPDASCPDFAWDDDHCAAVLAHGGYPALQFRRAA